MQDEERCDDEREVFNARVHEDEMIISIEEYKEMQHMINYYQELLNESIDLTEWKEKHNHMLSTLEIMKDKLKNLKGVK